MIARRPAQFAVLDGQRGQPERRELPSLDWGNLRDYAHCKDCGSDIEQNRWKNRVRCNVCRDKQIAEWNRKNQKENSEGQKGGTAMTKPMPNLDWGGYVASATCANCNAPIIQNAGKTRRRCGPCAAAHKLAYNRDRKHAKRTVRDGVTVGWQQAKECFALRPRPLNPDADWIIKDVAAGHCIESAILTCGGCVKTHAVAVARSEAAYRIRKLGVSFPNIAKLMGFADHSAAWWAVHRHVETKGE